MNEKTLRVLYNATYAKVGGGLSYSTRQLGSLAARDAVDITVLTSPWNHEALSEVCDQATNLTPDLVRVPNAGARFVWEQTGLPVRARHHDVLVCPGNFAPLVSNRPVVVILQNPNYVGHGRRLPQNARLNRRLKIGLSHLSMRRADLVVAISHALDAEIAQEPSLTGIRRVTIRSGAPDVRSDQGSPALAEEVVRLVGDGSYLLSVANDYPHKRLGDLARLARLLPSRPTLPERIVFVGDIDGARRDDLRVHAGSEADRLVFLGAVGDRPLVDQLYRQASVAVSTSELEAYPLTPQEAGSFGTKLVVTDIPPHREVTEGNASFFPVGDIDGLVAAIDKAMSAPDGSWSIDSPWALHGDQLEAALRSMAV